MKTKVYNIKVWVFEEEGGRLEMIVHSNNKGRYGIIENIFVEKEYRNKGVATKLIEAAKDAAETAYLYKIVLTCNKDLMGFYKNQEFKWQENGQAYCMRIDLNE